MAVPEAAIVPMSTFSIVHTISSGNCHIAGSLIRAQDANLL